MKRIIIAVLLSLFASAPAFAQKEVFANNCSSTLASSITNVATSMTVVTGEGATCPTITGSDYFYVVLAEGSTREFVKVTARSTDTFTITRAQQGSSASAFSAGATVQQRVTKSTLEDLQSVTTAEGTLPIGNGGTGQITKTLAMNALSPQTTKGDLACFNGTDVTRLAVDAVDGKFLASASVGACGLTYLTGVIGQAATADVTTTANATTTTFPTGLGVNLGVGQSAMFDCQLMWSGNTATNGIALTWVSTATLTRITGGAMIPISATDSATTQMFFGLITTSSDFVVGTATPTTGTVFMSRLWGTFTNATVAGSVVPAFRNEVAVAGNTITVYTNSSCNITIY